MAIAVGEQMQTWQAALTMLTTSPALDAGDYDRFSEQAKELTRRYGGWLVLSRADGQQLVNTAVASNVNIRGDRATVDPAAYKDLPHVSDLFHAAAPRRTIVSITVPVHRGDVVTHALHLSLPPDLLKDILRTLIAPTRLEAGWNVTLIDSAHRVIARIPDEPSIVGTAVPPLLRSTDLLRGPLEVGAPEGERMYVAAREVTGTPWRLLLSAPAKDFRRYWELPLYVLAGSGLALIISVVAVFLIMRRQVAQPINALSQAARDSIAGKAPTLVGPPPAILELQELRDAVMALAEKQILLREGNHRIKNSLQLVAGSVQLQARQANLENTNAYRDLQAHVHAIARLHERLYIENNYQSVDPFALMAAVCQDIVAISQHQAELDVHIEGTAAIPADDAGPFALMIAELVTNAVKHAPHARELGRVHVRGYVERREAVVDIINEGATLPPNFDPATQKGLGLRMCLGLAAQIKGTLTAASIPLGARFQVRVPLGTASVCQSILK